MHELLFRAYAAFNARDLDAALATMHPDVDWPNGWEGGRIRGRDGVGAYWTRQWAAIDPRVEPVGFATDDLGRSVATVRTVVRAQSGAVVSDGLVQHVYTIEDALIRRMDIQPA